MGVKRILVLTLVLFAIAASTTSVSVSAVEEATDYSVYLRPSVRFGSDERIITSFDLLVPFWQGEKNILFFNPRYSFDNRDGSEVNVGFGYRHLLFADHAILGINGYYDCRWTGWGTRHEQLGLGIEVMTDRVTGRFNGYFPVTRTQIGPATGTSGYYFRDVGIYTGTGSLEETLGGFDGEVGFKVPYLSKYLETWVYAGGYHFKGDYVDDVNGFSTRLEVIPTDFLRLGFEYRNDNLSGNQYFGEAAVTVPFSIDNLVKGKNPFEGIGKHSGGERTLHERLTEPVRRDVDVRLYNAGTGANLPGTETLVEDVVFVSEGAADGAGDGTFENPFASIAEAAAAMSSGGTYSGVTTIHVMDDGGDYAGGGTAYISNLLIWCSGAAHPIYGYITNEYLTSPDVYRLDITADNVEVLGGNFVDDYGIVSSGSGTYITGSTFTDNGTAGVSITGGSATISDSTFTGSYYGVYNRSGSATVTRNTFAGGAVGVISNGSVVVTDNEFNGIDGFGIYTYGGDATITGNTIANTIYGIFANGGKVGISENTITDSTCGIYGGSGALTITDNTIGTAANPITLAGIYLRTDAAADEISGNDIVVSGSDDAYGIRAYVASLILSDNNITVTAGGTAYGIYEEAGGALTGSITGGTITANGNNGAIGVYLLTDAGSIGDAGDPFGISDVTINTTATGDGGTSGGIVLSSADYLNAVCTNNFITATAANGYALGINEVADNNIAGSITGGTITASGYGAYGINLNSSSGSIGDSSNPFTISGVTINTTGTGGSGSINYAYGINIAADDDIYGSITGGTITAVADGTAAMVWGINLSTDHGSIGDSSNPFTISGVTIDAAITGTSALGTVYGVSLNANDYLYAEIENSLITATFGGVIGESYGVYEAGDNGLFGSITGGTITASGGGSYGGDAGSYGIYLESHSGSGSTSSIGSLSSPYTISGVTVNVNGPYCDAYGIYAYTDTGSIYGSVTGGSIIVTGGGEAYGIYEESSGDIFGSITGGTITASGTRGVGISLEAPGVIGDSGSPFTVSGNTITGTSTTDYAVGFLASADGGDIYALLTDNIITAASDSYTAYGVNEFASGTLGGGISGGSVTASGLGAEGAYLCGSGAIGSPADPYTISGVTFDVTAASDTYTYGVRYLTDGYLYASIVNSSITARDTLGTAFGVYAYGYDGLYGTIDNSTITATGVEANGVQLRSNGSIGSSSDPFTISGTTITATGSGGNAYGLYEFSNNGDIFGSFTGGTITGTSTGGNAYGIYLDADAGSIGGSTSPFTITGVTINATGTERAYGVYEHAYDTLYGSISNGADITASGLGAYGIYLLSDTGSIGGSGSPFTISGVGINSTATGVNYRAYGVYMESTGGDIYAVIEHPYITSTATGESAFAYGVYEDAAGDIYGEIHGGTIIASGGYSMYGVRLDAGGAIGSSGNYFTIYGATIQARDLGSADYAYGVQLGAGGNLYSLIEDNYITAGGNGSGVSAYGIYESAQGTVYGEISGGRITATGSYAAGIRLYPYSLLGDSTNPFTISDVRITATASDSGALGVYLAAMSSGDLYADIIDSTITATSEDYNAFGVYGFTSGDLHTTITDSTITATSENYNAYGLYEWAGGSISGGIWGGSVTVNGDDGATGVYLESLDSIGSSSNPFTVSAVTINATGTGDTSGLWFDAGDDLYSFIDGDIINATSESGLAYGVYEHAYDDLRGEFYSGIITASGLGSYGVYLLSDTGSIGSSSDPFTISRTRVTSTATGYYDVYGVYMESAGGNIYAAIKNANITAANGNVYGYGIFETAQGAIYGEISGGTITATGLSATGVWLDADSLLGDSANPFTISGAMITATGTGMSSVLPAAGVIIASNSGGDLYAAITGNTITATSESGNAHGIFEFTNGNLDTTITDNTITATSGGYHARGIYEWAGGSIDGGIWGGSITVNGDDSARAIDLYTSGSIGSSGDPFMVSGVTAYVTSDVARYFMYLTGSGSGASAIDWTGNIYTPYGGVWSGNYDTSGFVTNGPLFLDGITDAEVTP